MEIRKNEIGLPLLALGLDLAPVLIVILSSIIRGTTAFVLLFAVLLPVAGLITGIAALTLGKGRIGKPGKVLSIIAISLPLALVIFILVIFIGVVTGLISLM